MNTIGGLPVLDLVPTFEDPVSFKYTTTATPIESGTREVLFPDLKPQAALTLTYRFTNKADSIALPAFWEAMAGPKCSFWMPSWKNQLGIMGSPRAGATTLQMPTIGTGYGNTFLAGPNNGYASGRYIFVYDFVSPPQFLLVQSVATANGLDTLTLALPLPINLTSRRFICGMVFLMRFNEDKLEETWLDEECLEAKLTFVETINWRPDPEPQLAIPGYGAPVIGNETVNVLLDMPFTYQVPASNYPTSFAITSGALPGGIAFDTATGLFTGEIDWPSNRYTPQAPISYTIGVSATNRYGTGAGTVTIIAGVGRYAFHFERSNGYGPDFLPSPFDAGIQVSLDGGPLQTLTFDRTVTDFDGLVIAASKTVRCYKSIYVKQTVPDGPIPVYTDPGQPDDHNGGYGQFLIFEYGSDSFSGAVGSVGSYNGGFYSPPTAAGSYLKASGKFTGGDNDYSVSYTSEANYIPGKPQFQYASFKSDGGSGPLPMNVQISNTTMITPGSDIGQYFFDLYANGGGLLEAIGVTFELFLQG